MCTNTPNCAFSSFTTTSLTGMSIGPSFITARWIRTRPVSHWRVKASTISSHQSIASIASNTDRNGCRLNVVTSIRVTTSIPDSLDAHGRTEPCCLARKAFDKRTPGLFKVGLCRDDFIVLCSKTYYCFGATNKCTTKGLNKRQNNIDKDAFLE